MNLYAYAGNNPISFSDPFGLCPPKWLCDLIGASAGQEAVDHYAGIAADESRSRIERTAATIGGLAAALWTPETYGRTASVLTTAASVAPAVGTFKHFGMAEDAASFGQGMMRGSFATNRVTTIKTGAQAADRLSLAIARPNPNAIYTVKPEWWRFVRGPTRVEPIAGRAGRGWEFSFPSGTGAGTVSGPVPIP